MLGSRFDLAETLVSIAEARAASDLADFHADPSANEDVESVGSPEPVEAAAPAALEDETIEFFCADLERELVEVANQVHLRTSRIRFNCPVCDSVMDVCAAEHLPEFGSLDIQLHRLACDHCGMLTGRAFHPDVGYQALHR